jgi:hypothetical protein
LGVWILDEVMKGSISFCSAVAAFVAWAIHLFFYDGMIYFGEMSKAHDRFM